MVQHSSHKPKSSLLVSPVQTPSSASHHRMTKISVQGSGHNKPPANRLVKEGRFLDQGPFPPTPMLPGGLGQEPHQNSIQRPSIPGLVRDKCGPCPAEHPDQPGLSEPPAMLPRLLWPALEASSGRTKQPPVVSNGERPRACRSRGFKLSEILAGDGRCRNFPDTHQTKQKPYKMYHHDLDDRRAKLLARGKYCNSDRHE